jgi:hypothetical protein
MCHAPQSQFSIGYRKREVRAADLGLGLDRSEDSGQRANVDGSISVAGEQGTSVSKPPLSGNGQAEGQDIQGVASVLPSALGRSAELRWNQ